MSTFYNDVIESASAASSVALGMLGCAVSTVATTSSVALAAALTVSSAAAATDLVLPAYERDVVEAVLGTSEVPSQLVAANLVSSSAAATSSLSVIPESSVEADATATSTVTYSVSVTLADHAAASSVLALSNRATSSVVSSAAAKDSLLGFNDVDVAAQANATTSVVLHSVETINVVESGAASTEIELDFSSAAAVVSAANSTSQATSELQGSSDVMASATSSDSAFYPQLSQAWVMNTKSTAMCRYDALLFESVAQIGDALIGLGPDGFFQLDGDDDDGAPILASVRTGKQTFKQDQVKRLGDINFGYVSSGPLAVGITAYGTYQGTYTYTLDPRTADSPRGGRLVPGKGLRSRYFQFTFSNPNGVDFSIDQITVDVAASTTRRV